ncbi:SET domain-containing protein 3, partial [Elasticomyces elasticus]
MTGISSFYNTHSIPEAFTNSTYPSAVSHFTNGTLSPPAGAEDDGTIKCICGFADDDGNTVLCEKCNTWQHISCYYHDDNNNVPEEHFCADCSTTSSPTPAAIHWAQQWQRRRREEGGVSEDKKIARHPSKSHKKKQKDVPTDALNGIDQHERHNSLPNGRDHPPPAKKVKTNHRPSASLASLNGESRKRAHSNLQSYPSPSKSPQEVYRSPIIPRYTNDFLTLYDIDTGDMNATSNEPTIQGSQALSRWRSDSQLVTTHEDLINNVPTASLRPFVTIASDVNKPNWPAVSVETVPGSESNHLGQKPTWKFLRLKNKVKKHDIVGNNRWKELGHPDPFVFFHPVMDVFIDSRRSGTPFRYIRRSCKNNVTIKTYITPEEEVRHLFVASRDISTDEELTAAWYLPARLFSPSAPMDPQTAQQLDRDRCDYISKVLANFGDCACRSNSCLLDRFDRRCAVNIIEPPQKPTIKRPKKAKARHTRSPVGTGNAANSRAGSETVKAPDDEEDHKSTSGSSRSGVISRDQTPQGGLLDADPVLGTGLTAREIRKIQQIEKAAAQKGEKAEKAEKAKTKKRPSGGSNLNTPTAIAAKHFSYASTPDGTRDSGSPQPAKVIRDVQYRSLVTKPTAKPVRPTYVSVAIQTEPEK